MKPDMLMFCHDLLLRGEQLYLDPPEAPDVARRKALQRKFSDLEMPITSTSRGRLSRSEFGRQGQALMDMPMPTPMAMPMPTPPGMPGSAEKKTTKN